jgi:hypothetical protein
MTTEAALKEVCDRTHDELDRRIHSLETSLKDNLDRLYNKLDRETLIWAEKAVEHAKRPSMVTMVMVSFLSSTTVGLMVLILTHMVNAK